MQDTVVLGIDGGASKTNGLLMDRTGRLLAHARAGGSAIVGAPKPESCEVLHTLLDELCALAGVTRSAVARCGLGLNGIDFEDEFPDQLAGLSAALGLAPERVVLVNDGIVALWGANPSPASLIVQHGSGYTAACRSDYGQEELFDHLHVGGVMDMRYSLTTLVGRMILGMVPTTPLKEATLAAYGVEESRYCEAVYRHRIPADRIRRTVPMIFEAWQQGDGGAATLVEAAAADYALAVAAMIRRTGCDCPAVVLGGGQLRSAPEAFRELITARVRERYPGIAASAPILPPEHGAAMMAGFHEGLDPGELFAALQGQDIPSPRSAS